MRRIFSFVLLAGCAIDLAPAGELGASRGAIVNGERTSDYPTTVMLMAGTSSADVGMFCSGTLIGCDTVLTAAHCVCDSTGPECQSPTPATPTMVFLQHVGLVPVASVAVHPDYRRLDGSLRHDFAVLRLAVPVTGIAPTPLAAEPLGPGVPGTVVGYGRSGDTQYDYGIKQSGPVVTGTCDNPDDEPVMVCWDYTGAGANSCNGDSGGSVFTGSGATLAVAGVTSGSVGGENCLAGSHTVDGDVYVFRDYIAEVGGALGGTCGDLPAVGEAGAASGGTSGELAAGGVATSTVEVPAGTAELRLTVNARAPVAMSASGPAGEVATCDAVGHAGWCRVEAPAPGAWTVSLSAADDAVYQLTATTLADPSADDGAVEPGDDEEADEGEEVGDDPSTDDPREHSGVVGGCAAGGDPPIGAIAAILSLLLRRRRDVAQGAGASARSRPSDGRADDF